MNNSYQIVENKVGNFIEDVMNICKEKNLSHSFLTNNKEENLYRAIKDMYIPKSFEKLNKYLDPFCMMFAFDNSGKKMRRCGKNLVSYMYPDGPFDDVWDIKLIIKTIHFSTRQSRIKNISYRTEETFPPFNIDEDSHRECVERDLVINTIKKVMSERLVESMKFWLDYDCGSLLIPLASPFKEFFFGHFQNYTRLTRVQSYYESDGFHVHIKFQDPPSNNTRFPVFGLKVSFGSMYYPSLCVSIFRGLTFGLIKDSMYTTGKHATHFYIGYQHGYQSEHRKIPKLWTQWSRAVSIYLSSFEDKDTRSYFDNIQNNEKEVMEFKQKVLSTSIHPISPAFLLFAIHDLYSCSTIQLLFQKYEDINEIIIKIKSLQSIHSLTIPIFQRILDDSVKNVYDLWNMTPPREPEQITKYRRELWKRKFYYRKTGFDTSLFDLKSWRYSQNLEISILNQVFHHVTSCILLKSDIPTDSSNLDAQNISTLFNNIECNADIVVKDWEILLKEGRGKYGKKRDFKVGEKLQLILEKSVSLFQEIDFKFEIPFEFVLENRFSLCFREPIYILRSKLQILLNCEKSLELNKIINHVNFWIISLELLFFTILYMNNKNIRSSNNLVMFLLWSKEITLNVNQILSIFENEFEKKEKAQYFEDTLMEDVLDKKITIEEVQSLMKELCIFSSQHADRLIIPVLSNLYTLLCEYFELN